MALYIKHGDRTFWKNRLYVIHAPGTVWHGRKGFLESNQDSVETDQTGAWLYFQVHDSETGPMLVRPHAIVEAK